MNHTTIPMTAQGEPIPLVKYSQGREPDHGALDAAKFLETPQTFAAKLRAAGYQEPVLSKESVQEKISNSAEPLVELTQEEFNALTGRHDIPLVSQRGFKAGVFATCLGGAFLAALYLGAGALICGCVAAGCVGFVAGMLMTEEWK